jgi:hypothetical protein
MALEKEPTPTATVLYPPEPKPSDTEWVNTDLALEQPFNARESDEANVLGKSTAQREKERKEFIDMMRQSDLPVYELGPKLWEHKVDSELAQIRGGIDEEELSGRILRNNEEIRQELSGVYGREEAEKLLARADKWVRTQPKLHALLGVNGMGSRPDVVIPIVEHIRRIGWKG